MKDIDKRFVFASAVAGDGIPYVIIGLPRAAWEEMASHIDDKLWDQDCDLTKIGVPVRFTVFACESHEHGRKRLEQAAAESGITIDDKRRTDFSIAGNK